MPSFFAANERRCTKNYARNWQSMNGSHKFDSLTCISIWLMAFPHHLRKMIFLSLHETPGGSWHYSWMM